MKQIVGSTLRDSKEGDSSLITNYESDLSASEYAQMYKDDGLTGGHVIMLGADPLSEAAALEALHAYPGRNDLLPPSETFWCIFVMIPLVELIRKAILQGKAKSSQTVEKPKFTVPKRRVIYHIIKS